MKKITFTLLLVCLVLSSGLVDKLQAQEEISKEDLAEQAALASSNPLGGNFIILLNQWNIDFLQGDITNKTRNFFTHIFQPVVPIPVKFLCEYCIWVNRPTFVFIYSADLPQGLDLEIPPGGAPEIPEGPPIGPISFNSQGGFGDIIYFSLVGISKPIDAGALGRGDLVLAPGITTIWPVGSKEFSSNQYSAGPAAVAAFIGERFIFGALGQQWWSYGERSRGDNNPVVNEALIQYFYFMNFPGAWQIGGAPQIQIDFEAKSGDKLQWPVGLGIQKTIVLPLGEKAKLPIKLGVEAQYYVAQADTYGNEWRIQFTFAPVIPAPWANIPGM